MQKENIKSTQTVRTLEIYKLYIGLLTDRVHG